MNDRSGILQDKLGDNATQVTPKPRPEILLLTQVLPYPPDAGPKIKTFNLIKYLAHDYNITLVSFVRADNTQQHVDELLKYCAEVHTVPMVRTKVRDVKALLKSLVLGQPFLMVRDQSPEMSRLLARMSAGKKYSVVHTDQLNMAQFALPVPATARLLDQHNAVWTIADRLRKGQRNPAKRLVLELETFKLRRYEKKICGKFEAILAVSQPDAEALGLINSTGSLQQNTTIIPIGVDAEAVEPLALKPDSLNLVSLGTMFYPPNVEAALWFGKKVFPLIQEKQPQATYSIIGAKPPAEIYDMASQNPAIKVLGYVEELGPVLQECAGLVVPLLSGGGMRVKILDALALGLPIISTTVGAEGVRLENGNTALLADTPQEFAAACLQLLGSEELQQKLAKMGRELALEVYDFRRAYQPLDRVYSGILN